MKRRIMCLIVCILSFFISADAFAVDYGTVRVEIPVNTGWLTAEKPNPTHNYRIKITALTDRAPVPEEDVITIIEGDSGSFHIPVIEPGTFRYRVYEEDRDRPNINADFSVYDVSIYAEVTPEETLSTAVTITRNHVAKPDDIFFDDSVTGHSEHPYPDPDDNDDPDNTVVTTVDSSVTDSEEPPEPDDQPDAGEGLENDDDLIDDTDDPVETSAPSETESPAEPEPDDEDMSPIDIIVETLITPKTGNIRIASIAAVMGGALAALVIFVPKKKDKKGR